MARPELDWLDERYAQADARLRGEAPWDEPRQELAPYRPNWAELLLGGALAALAVVALATLFDERSRAEEDRHR